MSRGIKLPSQKGCQEQALRTVHFTSCTSTENKGRNERSTLLQHLQGAKKMVLSVCLPKAHQRHREQPPDKQHVSGSEAQYFEPFFDLQDRESCLHSVLTTGPITLATVCRPCSFCLPNIYQLHCEHCALLLWLQVLFTLTNLLFMWHWAGGSMHLQHKSVLSFCVRAHTFCCFLLLLFFIFNVCSIFIKLKLLKVVKTYSQAATLKKKKKSLLFSP